MIVVVFALAAPGAALMLHSSCNLSWRMAGDDQPQPPIRETWLQDEEAAPAAANNVIDDEGMPLFIPAHAG